MPLMALIMFDYQSQKEGKGQESIQSSTTPDQDSDKKSKEEGKDQKSIQSSNTPDPG